MTKALANINLKPAIFWPYGVALVLIFGLALLLRIWLPYDKVFLEGGWVHFQGTDAWYNMRLVENTVAHFPSRISVDPFTTYPYGHNVFFAPFFDWLLSGVVRRANLVTGSNPVAVTK
ncbi:STT3 domain-containing protein [Chloroflexota bacterium]